LTHRRWLLKKHAGIVGEIAGGEIVGAVDDDVVGADEVEGILAGDSGVMKDNFDVRIDGVDGFLCGLRFGPADVFVP